MKVNNSNRQVTKYVSEDEAKVDAVICLLPFIIPIVCRAIDKAAAIAVSAMRYGYDFKIKAGAVDISFTTSLF